MKLIKTLATVFIACAAVFLSSSLPAKDFSEEPAKKIIIAQPQKELREGERFDYAVYWMGLRIGSASLSVKEIINRSGRDLYHVIARARTHGFFGKLYRLDDTIQTYIDKDTMYPVIYEEDLDEKWRKSRQSIEFNQTNRTAIYKDRSGNIIKEIEIPRGVQDMLSCFYLFRTMKVEDGKTYNIWVNIDGQNWDALIKVVGVKQLEIRNRGVFDTFIISPQSGFKNMALARNRTFIYFTADEKRIPIYIKAFTSKGIITAVLETPGKF